MIKEFKGKYYFLSNFYECDITYDGITYKNSEAAFHAQKTLDRHEKLKFTELNPREAKKLGRKITLREDWESVKDQYMYEICLVKFLQNPDLKERLIATGNEILIEGTWWHDNYWGNCYCDKCKGVAGKNKLGNILMKIRKELRND